jgi:hypothetical protein
MATLHPGIDIDEASRSDRYFAAGSNWFLKGFCGLLSVTVCHSVQKVEEAEESSAEIEAAPAEDCSRGSGRGNYRNWS